jgi:hypothetical protein
MWRVVVVLSVGCGRVGFGDVSVPDGNALDASTCVDLMSDPDNCGTCGHSCLGGACSGGTCQAMTLVSGLTDVYRMVVDADNVYWTEPNAERVSMCPLAGCGTSPTVLATGQYDCRGIAIDATTVYWTDYGGGATDDVMSCAIGGCGNTPVPVATNQVGPLDVALQGTNIFWTDYNSSSVQGCALGSCATPVTYVSSEQSATGIAADADNVYWSDNTGTGSIKSCPILAGCGSGPTTICDELVHPFRLATDASYVYWTDDTRVMRGSKDGSSVDTLIDNGDNLGAGASDIVVDATNVYWQADGALVWCAVSGCNDTPTTLVPTGVNAIAVDDHAWYWSDGTSITKLAK